MDLIYQNTIKQEQDQSKCLSHLILQLEADSTYFSYHKASVLQGVMMQRIAPDYAELLHKQGLKPYSQYIRVQDGIPLWHIKTMSEQAYSEIIPVFMDDSFNSFTITHDNQAVSIKKKTLHTEHLDLLFDEFYKSDAGRYIRLEFLTPTAFKKQGKYSFYPELSNIYFSIMKKFDAVFSQEAMFSEETLEQLTEYSEISSYALRSVRFSLEGVKIPAFIGNITIKLHGPQTMKNFARLLFRFGEYSGVGIKTAIGMGAVRMIDSREGAKDDKTGV